jgi:hypothetical protein
MERAVCVKGSLPKAYIVKGTQTGSHGTTANKCPIGGATSKAFSQPIKPKSSVDIYGSCIHTNPTGPWGRDHLATLCFALSSHAVHLAPSFYDRIVEVAFLVQIYFIFVAASKCVGSSCKQRRPICITPSILNYLTVSKKVCVPN